MKPLQKTFVFYIKDFLPKDNKNYIIANDLVAYMDKNNKKLNNNNYLAIL